MSDGYFNQKITSEDMLSLYAKACMLLKRGQQEEALGIYTSLMELGRFDLALKFLNMAGRMHRLEVFLGCLKDLLPYLNAVTIHNNQEEVNALLFIVVDRRYAAARELLYEGINAYLQSDLVTVDFYKELLNLMARMNNREWYGEAGWLMELVETGLLSNMKLGLLRTLCMTMQLHIALSCSQEGLSKGLSDYVGWFRFYLRLLDRAELDNYQELYQLLLQSLRDQLNMAARSAMAEEYEAYQELYLLLGRNLENEEAKNRLSRLMQLVINYWRYTQPKSSRKQVRELEELLEPSSLTEEQNELLKSLY